MRFLIQHGEKVVCTVIVILCGVWIYSSLRTPDRSADLPPGVGPDYSWLTDVVNNGSLPASYPYQPARLTPYAEQLREHLERADQPLDVVSLSHTFYPQPERPDVMRLPPTPPPPPGVPVEPPALKGFSAEARQGKVVITCATPAGMKYFQPVRIDVLRGTTDRCIDRVAHTFGLASVADGTSTVETAAARADRAKSPNVIRRSQQETNRSAGRKETATTAADLHFDDTAVKAGETCYYRARVLARLSSSVSASLTIIENGQEIVLQIPERMERIQDSDGTTLYAGPWSTVVQAPVPVDLQLRYQCMAKATLPAGTPASQAGYSAFLGIRLWDAEAQAWSESSLDVAPGQPLKGDLKFKTGAATKVRAFDTGLVFQAIRPATKFKVENKMVPVTEARTTEDGELFQVPVLGKDGKFKYTVQRTVTRTPAEVAVFKEADSRREVRFVKGLGYGETLPADTKLVLDGEPEPTLEVEPNAKDNND
jgi:hypothetical protein